MTAIAIWCNHEIPENPGLWIAADSRVSDSDGDLLINDAAKIFALPVIGRTVGAEGLFTQLHYTHSYGYCFAGDTLLGQNAYLSLLPLLTNLVSLSDNPDCIPPLADVASYIHRYLSFTFDDCKVRRTEHSLFEVAVFGHCARTNRLSVYHFITRHDDDGVYKVTCKSHEHMQENNFIYLGARNLDIPSKIEAALRAASIPGRPTSRAPRYVIQDHIDNVSAPTIGGDLQLGIADKFGFRAFPLLKPSVEGSAIISYLGRDLSSDLRWVGPAFVGGTFIT